jgi:hypothetical protein
MAWQSIFILNIELHHEGIERYKVSLGIYLVEVKRGGIVREHHSVQCWSKKFATYPNYKLTDNYSIMIVSGQSSDHYLIYRVGLYFTAVRIYMAADCEPLNHLCARVADFGKD